MTSQHQKDATAKPSSMATYKRLLKQVLPYWPGFLIVVFGNILYSGVDSAATYLFKPILDKGFIGKDMHFLQMMPLIIIALFLVRGISGVASTYVMGWISRRVVYSFRKDLFQQLLSLPATYYDQETTGQLLAKITFNVEQLAQCNSNALTTIVRQSFLVIGLLVVMFLASWQLTLLIFLITPFVVLIIRYASQRFRKLSQRIQTGMGGITQTAEETISAYKEVRVFGGQVHQEKRFEKLIDYNFSQEMKLNLTNAINTPVVQLLGALVLALVVFFAFHGVSHISAGSFVTLFSAMIMILNPIKNLTKINLTIQRGIAAAESIYELVDRPKEQETGTQVLEDPKGSLNFDQVSFSYPLAEQAVLSQVSFKVEPGKTVALVGRSGGGKSTLVSLLSRFYAPTKGRVLLDGVDIAQLTLSNLRSHISIVTQQVNLFNDTLRHNIAFGDLEAATEERIIEAAKAAHAWAFIQDLPEGLDTLIGENGTRLSGGQRQRIAIARAILKDAPLLVLDEATSALDNESERAVKEAIDNLKKGRTTLIIAHRLSTIENADQILVMDQGQLLESGSHDQLLKQGGLYSHLYQSDL